MKYEVWYLENGRWENTAEPPMTLTTARRIAREVNKECRVPTRIVPAGSMTADNPVERYSLYH